jgi:uncharacterized membrane protein YfcA
VLEVIAIYLATGMLAGFVSGLFGVGGAFTMAPALIIALPLQGAPDAYVMHLTIGTALAVMTTTSAYVAVLRYRAGDLHLPLMFRFVPFIVAGALGGSLVGDALPGIVLKIIFIGFVVVSILRGIFYKQPVGITGGGDLSSIRGGWLWTHGIVTGITGSLLGPGPAILIAPYLRNAHFPMPMVSAISSALAGMVGLAATVGYIYGGFNEHGLPALSIGYLYLPAFAGLAAGALIGSPFGIRVSHKVADMLLHRLFIGYLAFILIVMLTQGR